MRHAFVRQFEPEDFAPPPSSTFAPLTPAAYVALRRKAAGLTVEQAAARVAESSKLAFAAADLIRQLETPGVFARRCLTLEHLRAAFPFNPDIYRQLQHQPANCHPRICRSCGCSADDDAEPMGDAVRMDSDTACASCVEAPAPGLRAL